MIDALAATRVIVETNGGTPHKISRGIRFSREADAATHSRITKQGDRGPVTFGIDSRTNILRNRRIVDNTNPVTEKFPAGSVLIVNALAPGLKTILPTLASAEMEM